jgi:glycosyltransferase involved in cell wall biosynthesis
MLTRSKCAQLVAAGRAAVVPSVWEEAFGLVAIEAMACGVAPIAPAHGSFPELIRDGHDGVHFEPGNSKSLASVLRDIGARPDHFLELGRNARTSYEQRFDPDANIDQLIKIYQFAITHPSR